MNDSYIQSILVNKVINLQDFAIPLCEDKKNHLIITGKNGSGKTSLLIALQRFLNNITNGQFAGYEQNKTHLENLLKRANEPISEDLKARLDRDVEGYRQWFQQFGGVEIVFNQPSIITSKYQRGEFIFAYFGAKRNANLTTPTGINAISIQSIYPIEEQPGKQFLQYIVNLKADRSFARDDNDSETVSKIDDWFSVFEKSLAQIFDTSISLRFNRNEYNFLIVENGKVPYNLNQLSDGYSAILNITTELIMRMEKNKSKSYDVEGVVLIDEIETHLHINLQKKILPFLTSFFPKIQFIVTTHSPFVISSIENSIICDLEKKITTNDLSGYSYDTLIESYFDSDKYSEILKVKISRYETLLDKSALAEIEKDELLDLKMYLNEIPKFISDELAVKLQQIKLKHMKRK